MSDQTAEVLEAAGHSDQGDATAAAAAAADDDDKRLSWSVHAIHWQFVHGSL